MLFIDELKTMCICVYLKCVSMLKKNNFPVVAH